MSNFVEAPVRRRAYLFAAVSLAAVAAASAPASAQTSGPAVIDRVVVTSEFRPSTVQDTPLSVTAVNAEMLEARSQTSIADVADQAPNVTLKQAGSAQGGSALFAYIRGVGQNDFSYALEPGVGLYVDDVYYPTLAGSLVELLDFERVEILRGPQGTLAGRNSLGGAVKLYSRQPGAGGEGGSVSVTGGGDDQWGVRGATGLTLVEDKLYARVSAMHRTIDGYVDQYDYDCLHPGSGLPSLPAGGDCLTGTQGGETMTAARAALRFEATPDINFTLTGDINSEDSEPRASVLVRALGTGIPFAPAPVPIYADIDGDGAFTPGVDVPHDCRFVTYGANSCDPNPQGKYASYSSFVSYSAPSLTPAQNPWSPLVFPQVTKFDEWGLSLNGEWRINDAFSLTSITAYREYRSKFSEDTDGSPLGVEQELQALTHDQFSQELRLNGSAAGGAVDFTVGGFYFEQDGALTAFVDVPYAGLNIYAGPDAAPSTNWAGFATATWHATEQLNLTGGLRYSEDEKTYNFRRANPDGTPIAGPCVAFPGFPLNPANCGVFGLDGLAATFEDERVDYRLAADYRWTGDLMTYVQYATGYKSGGVNPRPFVPDQLNSFGAEELQAWEAGFKSMWLGGSLRLNGAVFFNDYSDIQLNFTVCPASIVPAPCLQPRNAGDAEVLGWELETEWYASDALRFDASVGILDFDYTRIDALTAAQPDFVPPYTPELTASAGVQYEFDLGEMGSLTPRVDGTYQSAVYSEALNAPTNRISPYALMNARLTWRSEDEVWKAALEVKNVTDKFYFLTLFDLSNTAGYTAGQPGRPRTWAVTLTRSF